MYPPRTACFFERIYEDMALYSVRGPRFVPCSHLLHQIEDDTEWPGSLEPMVVCIRAVCQSTSDEKSQQIAS